MYQYTPYLPTIGDVARTGAGHGAAPVGAFPVVAPALAWRTAVRRLRAALLARPGG